MKPKNQLITLDIRMLSGKRLGRRGLTAVQLDRLAPRIKRIIARLDSERADGKHRFRDLPHDRLMRRAVEDFAKTCRPGTENLVLIGIGGSALGATALHQALNHPQHNLLSRRKRGGPRLFVMDNVDPTHFAAMLEVIKNHLTKTLFNVVTKSGETAETMSQFLIVRKLLTRRLGRTRARQRIVVTTDAHDGTMRSIAQREGYASLPIPEDVGGRFSVLSAVGLFSAAMCGIDIRAILRGAADMDQAVQSTSLPRNPAALFAAVHYLYYKRGLDINVMMPYSNSLRGLAAWFQQLWAESLGKMWSEAGTRQLRVGPTPVTALGATDQHSQLQLYREGPNNKLITFLEVEDFQSEVTVPKARSEEPGLTYLGGASLGELLNTEKLATEQSLVASGRACLTIRFPTISPHTVGQFIYLMECATVITAKLFGVNPYDQPGVELGKNITYHLMGRPGYEKIGGIVQPGR